MRAPLRNRIEALEARSAITDEAMRCITIVAVWPGDQQPKIIGARSGFGSRQDWCLARKPREDLAALKERAEQYALEMTPAPTVAMMLYEHDPEDVKRIEAEREAQLRDDASATAAAMELAKASR